MAKTIVSNVVIFLGNGFDLDLGLPTKYSNFASETNIRITGTVLLIHVNNRTRNSNVLMTNGLRYVQRKEPYKGVRIINGV